jgi:hypothetical protein
MDTHTHTHTHTLQTKLQTASLTCPVSQHCLPEAWDKSQGTQPDTFSLRREGRDFLAAELSGHLSCSTSSQDRHSKQPLWRDCCLLTGRCPTLSGQWEGSEGPQLWTTLTFRVGTRYQVLKPPVNPPAGLEVNTFKGSHGAG